MTSNFKIAHGDCLSLMKKLPDNSIDLVVTDPPYDVHAGKGGSVTTKSIRHEIYFLKR